MRNARLDGAQAGIKVAGRNINNLRYTDDTTLMAESEEKLKNYLMKVKEESERAGLKLNLQKTIIELPFDPAILLLGIYPDKTINWKDMCGPMFTAALFTTAQSWKWEHQTTWPASWEICMQVKKQQLELGMEQQISSKKGKEYVKVVYCHPVYLIYMQSTSCEMPGWVKRKLESRLSGEISITPNTKMTSPLW